MLKYVLRTAAALFGAALIINGILLIIFANSTIGSYLTVFWGFIFLLPAVFFKKTVKLLMFPFFNLITVFAVFGFACSVITAAFLYLYGTDDNVTYNEDYLIVLGCGLRGETPTEPLRARLDTALGYLEQNRDCKVIVSGGRGSGESITEAEAMRRYLTERGVEASRIITEGKSTSTTENFRFSNKQTENELASSQAAFVTNDFHIYRAYSLARLQGFNFTHIHADTSWYNLAPSYLREILAIGQMIVFKY